MPKIIQDVHPADFVIIGSASDVEAKDLTTAPATEGAVFLSPVRVIVYDNRILVAKDTPTGPVPVFSKEIDPQSHYKASRSSRDHSYLVTKDGEKVAYRRDPGCGCGSRLRSWNPFGTMGILSSNSDPTE